MSPPTLSIVLSTLYTQRQAGNITSKSKRERERETEVYLGNEEKIVIFHLVPVVRYFYLLQIFSTAWLMNRFIRNEKWQREEEDREEEEKRKSSVTSHKMAFKHSSLPVHPCFSLLFLYLFHFFPLFYLHFPFHLHSFSSHYYRISDSSERMDALNTKFICRLLTWHRILFTCDF